jgi:UDP-N-acetylmuramyl pentapeptide phosphotransferase/UDP-N-acetylglucosamine-1-phosphate transferase
MLILLILSALLSVLGCGALLRAGQESSRRYWQLHMPQRFHIGHVPRLGGAAMLLACCAGWLWMAASEHYLGIANSIPFGMDKALSWVVVATLGVAAGIIEDMTHRLKARSRLFTTGLAAMLATGVFGLTVQRLDLPLLDTLWQAMPTLGVALAVLAVAGLPHSINIIDGYNGLAGLLTVITCLAIFYVALSLGDRELAGIVLVLAGATCGFLVWNFPRGLIFAGDGGAYLWGLVIAIVTVQLVQRHPQVSPWFPVLLLIYPIWETIFSIWRKLTQGRSPGMADGLHFHHLIFRRIVRQVFHDDEQRRMLIRNNRTSPYLWAFTIVSATPAALFYRNTPILLAFIVLFVVAYLWAYWSIIRFRAQRWVPRR